MESAEGAMQHDSMVTVRLSEPPVLSVDTHVRPPSQREDSPVQAEATPEREAPDLSPKITMMDPNGNEVASPSGSESEMESRRESRRGSDSSDESGEGPNWDELEKHEEEEPKDQDSDDSTALLLARLEQENNLLATNPKSGLALSPVDEKFARVQSRPPSMHHLKRLVNEPTPAALRYSKVPPPPMTDLEFWAALVQDYTRTAQYLPTLLSKKIRSGVPPPLRGVVWQSMSGARDKVLEDQFDRLCGDSSPYEGIIGKDLGRSFPGVEMFRDPNGDGQKMLGRVLKCFSLYDTKIGYCQGLGFLVGPLLMHMGEKQAFCVLVRLMEHYDLRNCFLPDLSGLHVRIFQFRELLKRHLPTLDSHLEALQVEPAYVSQWFLSFFAVTCPLPMLFRIYDVIFAEGASETIMRVALSLMRKNEARLLACSEFEDVMQLLLSRGLWDCYHYNADEFVNDFVGLTGIVTRESLQILEASYKEEKAADAGTPSADVGSAASRFLGRLWAGSNASTKSVSLSPGLVAPSRPVSFLRRSPSKQSLASTLNSIEGGGGTDSMLSTTTDATSVSRDSQNTDGSAMSIRGQSVAAASKAVNKDKDLHVQIEDLLTALSEQQRSNALLVTQLQREREEREEDRNAVRSLLNGLRKKSGLDADTELGDDSTSSFDEDAALGENLKDEDEDPISEPAAARLEIPAATDNLAQLLDVVEDRFSAVTNSRRSSMMQTKSQLRDDLSRAKEQLVTQASLTQDCSRRIVEQDQEISNLKDQVRDSHSHIRNSHQEKQRLEKQIYDLRTKKPASSPDGSRDNESEWPSRSSGASTGGLRELKLGRQNSGRSQKHSFSKRASSLSAFVPPIPAPGKENEPSLYSSSPPSVLTAEPVPIADNDALLLELVQAKTAAAIAKQEADEAKAKLKALRELLGANGVSTGPAGGLSRTTSQSLMEKGTAAVGYMQGRSATAQTPPAAAPTSAPNAGGGFWGGWGKRVVSAAEK